MTVPNALPEWLESESRIRERAEVLLARHAKRRTIDVLLARRPELADLALPGVVLADAWRSA